MTRILADLATFAYLEIEAGDIEPWAAVLGALHDEIGYGIEQVLWLTKLYNAYDDLGSAWQVFQRWTDPHYYKAESDRLHADQFVNSLKLSRERRNLRGGRVSRHLNSYTELLGHSTQWAWLSWPLGIDPFENFLPLMDHLRQVWGVGRLTAFEWGEFATKVGHLPVEPPDAYLWESSGPRESLERIYGLQNPTKMELSAVAKDCRDWLEAHGIQLSWWDFETVICDFNVMRKGRYYPGQHIAMIREEIEAQDPHGRKVLGEALRSVIPVQWQGVPPGVDKALAKSYRDTGLISTPVTGRAAL